MYIQCDFRYNMNSITVIFVLAASSLSEASVASPRIYNGMRAWKPINSIVSIRDSSHKHICGGTIIDAQWILTAAHCVAKQTNLSVLAGAIDNSLPEKTSQSTCVDYIEIHNLYDYDPENIDNDIALLHLERQLTLSEKVFPIPVMTNDIMEKTLKEKNYISIIAGWGATEDAYSSKKLMWGFVTLLDPEECLQDIPESCHNFNPEAHICSGPLHFKTGAGEQDDGGPLFINDMLAGIINHGEHDPSTDPDPCHKSTIYISVPYYLDWILKVVEKKNATVPSSAEIKPSPEDTIPSLEDETSSAFKEKIPDSGENISPAPEAPAPEEITPSPEETTPSQEEITSASAEQISDSEETTSAPEEITASIEEITSDPEEKIPENVVFLKVEITLTPEDDLAQQYSLSHREWWYPESEESFSRNNNYANGPHVPSVETGLEQDGQSLIQHKRIIIITLQFYFIKGDYNNFRSLRDPSVVKFHSAVETREV